MKNNLFTARLWLSTYRTQIQFAVFAVVLALTLVALFAPGSVSLADQIVISGH